MPRLSAIKEEKKKYGEYVNMDVPGDAGLGAARAPSTSRQDGPRIASPYLPLPSPPAGRPATPPIARHVAALAY
ncbi:hypothetical protein VTH06DRAFT_7437 [Thermothelomyces fergusii]